jgi:alanyl-tRNA synthetase
VDTNTIRETFLSFYEDREHRRVASAPLIPSDPTLLLTIAGMVPFKPFFLGDAAPPAPRLTSAQKCVRTNDIENVGRTTRHMSFFEMLGNFSFGDYFKREAIRWSWQLSVDGFGLDPDRIWVTVFEDDDESERLWLEETDVLPSQIQRVGVPAGATRKDASDNFWSTGGAGPCGPCSELNYDRGPDWGDPGGPEVNGERYLEYYHLVFMHHEQDADGNVLGDLPAQNVDTGLGLERMAVLLQDADDIFDTDIFVPLLERAGQLTGHDYGGTREGSDLSLRVIAEHARSSAFLIADGVLPSKEGRGYVLRRLLRRVVRHARLLGTDEPVMPAMVAAVIDVMREGYPELETQRELVTRVAGAEEQDFSRVIASGLARAESVIEAAPAGGTFDGAAAFELHDTFGFPVDLTAEIAEDAGLSLDRDEFDRLMTEQRERARAAARRGGGGVPDDVYREAAARVGATDFLGYEQLAAEAELGALLVPGGLVDSASEGDELELVVARTPFYAEGGGQVGDHGAVETATGRLRVVDTRPAVEGVTTHRVVVEAGEVTSGQLAQLTVDRDRRVATGRSHSATHVLHATMKEVLGSHAQQAGSLVQPGRLRFDFPHFEPASADQLAEIERTINRRVVLDPGVTTEVMPLDDAKAAGAVANFGDKYGQVVRVVTIGDFSKELCGGTHVPNGAEIGPIYLVREESIGSNTRRVEAVTGLDAHAYARAEMQVAEEVARLVGASTDEAVARVQGLMERLRAVEKELEGLRAQALAATATRLADDATRDTGGTAVVTAAVDVEDGDELRRVALDVRGRLGERAIVVLGATTGDGKAVLVAALTQDLLDEGVEARPVLHPAAQVVGGGAGGRGDLIQAGGRDGGKLTEALELAGRLAREAVSGE